MPSLRESARRPLLRLLARILILALVAGLLPADARASATTSPATLNSHALPDLASEAPVSAREVLVCVVVVVADPLWLTKSAFGELLGHSGIDPQPYAFAGEPYDPNSGFQYHRARWMDPRVGGFTGVDPFGGSPADPSSLHRYTYVAASPIDRRDPTGRFWIGLLFAWIGQAAHERISHYYEALGGTIDLQIGDGNRKRPDIRFHDNAAWPGTSWTIPGTAGEVYEIKPSSKRDLAAREVQEYIAQLAIVYPTTFWHGGFLLQPFPQRWPGILVHPFLARKVVVVELFDGGAIGYHFEDDTTGQVLYLVAVLTVATMLISYSNTAGSAQLGLQLNLSSVLRF